MRSYTIANRQPIGGKTIKARESKKIAIPELFDMIAGSETGAITASYLSIKNDDPAKSDDQPNKYWASDVSSIYLKYTD